MSGQPLPPIIEESEADSDEDRDDDDDDDESAGEMNLSKDFYPTAFKPQSSRDLQSKSRAESTDSSGSSAREMQLSKDFYPSTVAKPTQSQARAPQKSTSSSSEWSAQDFSTPTPPKDKGKGKLHSGLQSSQAEPSVRPKTGRTLFGGTSGMYQDTTQPLEIDIPVTEQTSSERRRILGRNFGPNVLDRYRTQSTQDTDMEFKWDHFGQEYHPYDDMTGLDTVFAEEAGEESTDSEEETISSNICEDVIRLRSVGYYIEYPDRMLGEGFFGTVYRGYYGSNATDLNDPNVKEKQYFAVKVVEFDQNSGHSLTQMADTLQRREQFEVEKYILTNVYHKNVVSIRMIINMGDQRSYAFSDKPMVKYISPDRVYMIMDFADKGDLQSYLDANYRRLDPYVRINFIRDLFFGMQYLHTNDIVHGDVHTGNVLIFTEGDEMVAKWTDFGLGYVGSDKQYKYRQSKSLDINLKFKRDIECTYFVMRAVINNRFMVKETPEVKALLNEFEKMIKLFKTAASLLQIFNSFKYLLVDELVLSEQHYQ